MRFKVGDTIFLSEKIYNDGRRLERTIMQVRGWYYVVDDDDMDDYGVNESTMDLEKTLKFHRHLKLERICK